MSGASTAAGATPTDAAGRATFCYSGTPLAAADEIRAYADANADEHDDSGEPAATATFDLPASSPGCSATFGGRIAGPADGKATFGGNAFAPTEAVARGEETYTDHADGLRVEVTDVRAVVCAPGRRATIYGHASVNGGSPGAYRISVVDAGSALEDPAAGRVARRQEDPVGVHADPALVQVRTR